jgi:A/G-specific adenine glycosylase
LALKEPENQRAFQSALMEWFARSGRDLPWRRTRDPYAILVSEFMLQQTQVATVLDYYRRWLERFPDAVRLADAPLEEVLRAWEGLGYYARARNLHRAAQTIRDECGGEFPRELEQIAALPGVGRYTAGAVATFAFDISAPIVDANIARVLARITHLRIPIDAAPGQRALWAAAEELLPTQNARLYNSALMELGAVLCRPRQPQCLVCPVLSFCAAAPHDPERLPIKKARRETVAIEENCAWIVAEGRLLLQQETGSRWRGLWKLPPLGSLPNKGETPLFELTYPFTHHAVTLRVYGALPPGSLAEHQAWHPLEDLESAAMAAPHRRAVRRLHAMQRDNLSP